MDRSTFLSRSFRGLAAALAAGLLPRSARAAAGAPADTGAAPCAQRLEQAQRERDFIDHWVTDLLDTMDAQLDEPTRIRLMEGCGRGCYLRHRFKQQIAEDGRGDVDRLVAAYRRNFEVWKDGGTVHVRYGAVSKGCYCPVVRDRHPKGADLHCECTRATHQSIFEAALGRPVPVEILESVRRGGRTCHFMARV